MLIASGGTSAVMTPNGCISDSSFLQHSQRRTSSPAVFQRRVVESQMRSCGLQQTEMTSNQYTEPAEVGYHQKPYTPGYSASVSDLDWKMSGIVPVVYDLCTSQLNPSP